LKLRKVNNPTVSLIVKNISTRILASRLKFENAVFLFSNTDISRLILSLVWQGMCACLPKQAKAGTRFSDEIGMRGARAESAILEFFCWVVGAV